MQLCGLPPDIGKMRVNWKISCEETENFQSEWTNTYDYNNSGKHWGKNRFSFEDFQQFNELTIYVEIKTLKLFESYEETADDIMKSSQFLYGNGSQNNINKSANVSSAMLQSYGVSMDEKESFVGDNDMEQRMDILSKTVDEMRMTIKELTMKLNKLEMKRNDDGDNKVEEVDDERAGFVKLGRNNSENEREVGVWLDEVVGLSEYLDVFVKNGFDDMKSVKAMKMEDLNVMGIDKQGHKRKIMMFVEKLDGNEDEEIAIKTDDYQ